MSGAQNEQDLLPAGSVYSLPSNATVELCWWLEGSQDQFRVQAQARVVPAPDHPLRDVAAGSGLATLKVLDEAGEVRVDIGLDPDGLSAEVRDNGPGVPANLNPFTAGQTTKGRGRGHGLAGVAALVQAVGGEVWHERQGGWTVFGVNLPLDSLGVPPTPAPIMEP